MKIINGQETTTLVQNRLFQIQIHLTSSEPGNEPMDNNNGVFTQISPNSHNGVLLKFFRTAKWNYISKLIILKI